ncbi:response regulator [Spirulina subsalsa FACHB-351]|uniref:histidine kinase n=1 Tax=Spirulina subsalsa FACHB-351 TaxID=234711 RepID=A0ABT3L6S7_9CYAN|nr:response regulator [Spirulina subsalsa]MCW6036882.1 response regulator [Spirulina subsalsa FACHB-351]
MSVKLSIRWLTHLLGHIPLRVILIVPFTVQIFGTVALIGWFSYRNGQNAVTTLADQLRNQISGQISQTLTHYLELPHKINSLNQDILDLGLLEVNDLTGLQQHFWRQMQQFDQISYIYFGNEQGEYIGIERWEDGVFRIEVTDENTNGDGYTYLADDQGNRQELIKITPNYDPRRRPWYTVPRSTGQSLWSEIYAYYSEPKLTVSANHPYFNPEGELKGVLGADLVLADISEFLRQLTISPSGQTFILETSGKLVATSTKEFPFLIDEQQNPQRLDAKTSQDLVTQKTTEFLSQYFGHLSSIKASQHLDFTLNQETQYIQVVPFSDPRGIDWIIVVVVPESDFMAEINANRRTTILLCLGALIVAIILGIISTRWITQPILDLKQAASSLSEGDFSQNVELDRTDELGVLAAAFNRMAHQLQESFHTLEQKNAELQQLNRLKDEFLANTSHELRTPLNGIIGLAESLIDGATGELPEETKTNLAMISASGQRLSNLVNDLLDFSKLRHHRLDLQIKSVNLKSIAEIVLKLSHPLVQGKPIELQNKITDDLPLSAADENRLQQILYNLIGNAIKFTQQGEVAISAKVLTDTDIVIESQDYLATLIQPNGCLAITISDTGIGISADKVERIFEAFEQGDGSTARAYGGTGLGLAVTQQLVELHGGKITVISQVDEGSEFTFTLPIALDQKLPQGGENFAQTQGSIISKLTESEPSEVTASDLSLLVSEIQSITATEMEEREEELKILIVDDEPVNLQVLRNNLSLQNYSITQATDGLEALQIIENGFVPDLMLLDVMMPRMTGYEVSQKIREKFLPSELPIVMLTAKNQVTDLVEGFGAGANDYLTKPFSKNELLARIKTHINLAKITAAYGRFVPHDFLHFLGYESILDVKLGDHIQKEMSILFTDIRSFTTLSEGMSPEENFNFINRYLSLVSPAIRDNNGFIDKYIGDAIMALFTQSVDDAVQGAIALQGRVKVFNQEQCDRGHPPITIGIGIHTGTLMLGTIGEKQRMESTVIADAVNLASRLEGLTKLYRANILISGTVFSQLTDIGQYDYRFVDRVRVKGKNAPVAVFEVFNGDNPPQRNLKRQTKTQVEQAVVLYYQGHLAQAESLLREIAEINPEDGLVHFYLQRISKP